MTSMRCLFRGTRGLAFLLLGGCVSTAPYGYGTYPGNYGSPSPGYSTPPGMYNAPPGSYSAPPGGSFPTPALGPSTMPGRPTPANQPTFDPGGTAPPFQGQSGGNKPEATVPVPLDDPGAFGMPRPSSTPGADNKPFGAQEDTPAFDTSSQVPVPNRTEVARPESFASVGAEAFQSPTEKEEAPVSPAGKSSNVQRIAAATSAPESTANPYDYDRKSYSWLRGIVDQDERDHSWQIIYNPNPDPNDQYGGAFCLADSPNLKKLHDGDLVYVEGRVNPQRLDSRKKPMYEVKPDEIAHIQHMGNRASAN